MDTESFYPKKMLGPLSFLLIFQLPPLQAFPRLSRRARRARAWSKVCERGMTGTSAERTQGIMGRKRVKQLLVSVVSFPSHNGDNTMATTIIASQIITLCVYLELDWKTLFFNQEILKINRGDLNCEWNIKHEIITVLVADVLRGSSRVQDCVRSQNNVCVGGLVVGLSNSF